LEADLEGVIEFLGPQRLDLLARRDQEGLKLIDKLRAEIRSEMAAG
jgi:hypothetical protein